MQSAAAGSGNSRLASPPLPPVSLRVLHLSHPPPPWLPSRHLPRTAELGIDIPSILSRTRSILTFRLAGHEMSDLDMGGPLIFMAALGFAHLLVRAAAAWHGVVGSREDQWCW